MKLLPSSDSTYYSGSLFGLSGAGAVLYSIVTHLYFACLGRKPLRETISRGTIGKTKDRRDVAIVTGSNTGVGFETARSLVVDYGMEVILACRSRDKAEKAAALINSQTPTTKGGKAVVLQPLDLASLASVKNFAAAVKSKYETVRVLINNAGINTPGPSREADLDLVFQCNVLGHFLLTSELMDVMAEQGRIVNLSSVMHHFCGGDNIYLEAVNFWKQNVAMTGGRTSVSKYSLSKLAAILFTIELNRRYSAKIRSIAVNPGAVNSDIWRNSPRWVIPLFSLLYLTCRQGCQTSVAAAVGELPDDAIYLQPYWVPRKKTSSREEHPLFPVFEMLGPFQGHRVTRPRLPRYRGGAAAAAAAASALWTACEELCSSLAPCT